MSFLRILVVLIAVAYPTSLLADTTHECTYLDKSYWIPVETFKSKLVKHGRKLVDFQVIGTCYEAVVKEKDGHEYEGVYDPASGYPITRKLK